jgi:hypothetical protein
MTADGQRIASLERQVAGLSARVEQFARQAAVIRSLEELFFESRGYDAASFETTSATLKAAFDAGRASVLEDPARRAGVACRPRHLQVVSGGAS